MRFFASEAIAVASDVAGGVSTRMTTTSTSMTCAIADAVIVTMTDATACGKSVAVRSDAARTVSIVEAVTSSMSGPVGGSVTGVMTSAVRSMCTVCSVCSVCSVSTVSTVCSVGTVGTVAVPGPMSMSMGGSVPVSMAMSVPMPMSMAMAVSKTMAKAVSVSVEHRRRSWHHGVDVSGNHHRRSMVMMMTVFPWTIF